MRLKSGNKKEILKLLIIVFVVKLSNSIDLKRFSKIDHGPPLNSLPKNFKDLYKISYSEKIEAIALVQIPEWKLILNEKIIRYKKNHGNLIRKYGHAKNCNLTDIKLKKYQKISICPWHHVLTVRKDRYPYMRVNSECNCDNCMFKNDQLEGKIYKFECQQEFTLMPALEKVDFKFGDYNESRWIFGMEEVATSCVCMRKLL